MTVSEVLREVEKDKVFYASGGEPLMQSDFTLALLRRAKERELSTAIETCGHFDPALADALLGVLDTIYVDIKRSTRKDISR